MNDKNVMHMAQATNFEEMITWTEYKSFYDTFKQWAKDAKGINPTGQKPAKFKELADEYLAKLQAAIHEWTGHHAGSYNAFYAERMQQLGAMETGGEKPHVAGVVRSAMVQPVQPATGRPATAQRPFPTFQQWLIAHYNEGIATVKKRNTLYPTDRTMADLEFAKRRKKKMLGVYLNRLAWKSMVRGDTLEKVAKDESELSPHEFRQDMHRYLKMMRGDLKHMFWLYKGYDDAKHEVEKRAKVSGHVPVREITSPAMRAKYRELAPWKARRDAAIHELQGLARSGKIEAEDVSRLNLKTNGMWSGIMADLELDYLVDLDKLSTFDEAVKSLETKVKKLKRT